MARQAGWNGSRLKFSVRGSGGDVWWNGDAWSVDHRTTRSAAWGHPPSLSPPRRVKLRRDERRPTTWEGGALLRTRLRRTRRRDGRRGRPQAGTLKRTRGRRRTAGYPETTRGIAPYNPGVGGSGARQQQRLTGRFALQTAGIPIGRAIICIDRGDGVGIR
jgi:hypothetical protein